MRKEYSLYLVHAARFTGVAVVESMAKLNATRMESESFENILMIFGRDTSKDMLFV